jgi:hypothetical protein
LTAIVSLIGCAIVLEFLLFSTRIAIWDNYHLGQLNFRIVDVVALHTRDRGIVYVFDRMTGNKMVELKVAEGGMVQTVTVGG